MQGGELALKAAPGGVGAEARLALQPVPDAAATAFGPERLALAAATRHRTIVVLVDELQAATPADTQTGKRDATARRTSASSHSSRRRWPPQHPHHVARQQDEQGLSQRLVPINIGNLDGDATRDALEIPFADAGRSITGEALDLLADSTNGYPYAVQWVGYHAREQAAQSTVVTIDHAQRSVKLMEQRLEATIYASRWQEISTTDRADLQTAARLVTASGSASTADIAAELGKPPSDLTLTVTGCSTSTTSSTPANTERSSSPSPGSPSG